MLLQCYYNSITILITTLITTLLQFYYNAITILLQVLNI